RHEPGRRAVARVNRRTSREGQVDQQLRPVRSRKELLRNEPQRQRGQHQQRERSADRDQRARIAQRSRDRNRRMIASGSLCVLCFMVAGKIATPSSGAKMTATAHDTSRAMATTVNIENVYSPAALFANPIGMKPTTVTNVPVSIGKAVDVYANVAARAESSPSSSLVTIISTVIIASSTSRPRAMMRAPSATRCRSIPA